jgi:hypothetical protein
MRQGGIARKKRRGNRTSSRLVRTTGREIAIRRIGIGLRHAHHSPRVQRAMRKIKPGKFITLPTKEVIA